MLIPDLLNILFDQSCYRGLITMRSLNKRATRYANKYSISLHYDSAAVWFADADWALVFNANNGNVLAVKYLISIGANIHVDDDFALGLSAMNGYLETFKYLVSVGADIHADDDYALRYSALHDRLEVVKYLIGIGANIHVNNDELFSLKIIRNNFGHLKNARRRAINTYHHNLFNKN